MIKRPIGIKENLAGTLCYILGPFALLSGLFFLANEEKNRFVRFHALQAIFFSVAWLLSLVIIAMVLLFSPVVTRYVISLISIAGAVVWALLMTRAYQGKIYMLPIIGKLALEISPGEGEGPVEAKRSNETGPGRETPRRPGGSRSGGRRPRRRPDRQA